MYHSVSEEIESDVPAYYRTTTSPIHFREQMQWLEDNGYSGVTLSQGIEWQSSSDFAQSYAGHGGQRPEVRDQKRRLVAITFDDGFRNFYTTAHPILKEHGFSASVFLPTALIGDTKRHLFKSRECMTWSEVIELHKAGIHFGSHTVSHPKLVELDWPAIESEIRNSKSEIENHLGVPCTTFAYPYAFPEINGVFVTRFCKMLKDAGYHVCATTRIGRAKPGEDLFQLKRLPVNSCDGPELFQAKLEGCYDWLARFQRTIKRFKQPMRFWKASGWFTPARQVSA